MIYYVTLKLKVLNEETFSLLKTECKTYHLCQKDMIFHYNPFLFTFVIDIMLFKEYNTLKRFNNYINLQRIE